MKEKNKKVKYTIAPFEHRKENAKYFREYIKRESSKIKRLKYIKEWKEKNYNKYIAQSRLKDAVRYGKLKKKPCEVCGKPKVHGHHPDYSKPLFIKWLCPVHHFQEHKRLKLISGGNI